MVFLVFSWKCKSSNCFFNFNFLCIDQGQARGITSSNEYSVLWPKELAQNKILFKCNFFFIMGGGCFACPIGHTCGLGSSLGWGTTVARAWCSSTRHRGTTAQLRSRSSGIWCRGCFWKGDLQPFTIAISILFFFSELLSLEVLSTRKVGKKTFSSYESLWRMIWKKFT